MGIQLALFFNNLYQGANSLVAKFVHQGGQFFHLGRIQLFTVDEGEALLAHQLPHILGAYTQAFGGLGDRQELLQHGDGLYEVSCYYATKSGFTNAAGLNFFGCIPQPVP